MRWQALLGVASVAACAQHATESQVEQDTTMLCPTQTVEGVDVYSGDGTIDWSMLEMSGRQFAFIKATQGDYNKQSTFASDWAGALAAGVLRSPYHFFDATVDGKTQAMWFLNEVAAGGGLQPGDLPPMLDLECPTSSSQSQTEADCLGTGASGWAPSATVLQGALDWLGAVEQATGRKAFIYSYVSWFASVGVTDARLAQYPLFIASYNACASIPAPWTTTVFWQYGDTGTVPGITKQADTNRFIGSAGDLMGLTGSGSGSNTPDAGLDMPDGPLPDGGNPEMGGGAGCGCHSDGVPSAAWLLLALPFIPRRLARSRRRTPSSGRRRR